MSFAAQPTTKRLEVREISALESHRSSVRTESGPDPDELIARVTVVFT